MDNASKKKLYVITFLIDSFLIYILFFKYIPLFDIIWIFSVLSTHSLFYYGLMYDDRELIDGVHPFVFILPLSSLFAKHILLKIISLMLVITIQFLWIKEKRCIMNELNQNTFGYGDLLHYSMISLTAMLSLNIGYSYRY